MRTLRELRPWRWMACGVVLFFLVPFVGADLIGLQPDLYYLIYFTIALGWFALFVGTHEGELRAMWRLNRTWSLAVGAVAGISVVAIVFSSAGTAHPDGWRWWFAIGWRGVVYGSVDALTLFVFPAAVAHLLMSGDRSGTKRKVGSAGLVVGLSLLMSAAYHLGYPEYRDADLRSPIIGTVIADSAALLTGNPIGALITHVPAHVAAAVHQYEGGPTQMLPPKVSAGYPTRGDGDLVPGLAVLWLVGVAGATTAIARRRRRS